MRYERYESPPVPPLRRYWVSWYAPDDGATLSPCPCWISGETLGEPVEYTFVALIDAVDEVSMWEDVASYFPRMRPRFVREDADKTLASLASGGRFIA